MPNAALKRNSPLPEQTRLLASYGRRRGRPLRTHRQQLTQELLPGLSIALPEQGMLDLRAMFPGLQETWLEIGFGGGEHLARQAEANRHVGIIGCEPYVNGMASLLAHIEERKLSNVRLYGGDGRLVIARLPQACLSRVFVLYPDPWPKVRHHKRRLVARPFLKELARVMKPGGELRLATDDAPYASWMLEHLLSSPDFTWQAEGPADWKQPWDGWQSTRYEAKALAAGRSPAYFRAIRR